MTDQTLREAVHEELEQQLALHTDFIKQYQQEITELKDKLESANEYISDIEIDNTELKKQLEEATKTAFTKCGDKSGAQNYSACENECGRSVRGGGLCDECCYNQLAEPKKKQVIRL